MELLLLLYQIQFMHACLASGVVNLVMDLRHERFVDLVVAILLQDPLCRVSTAGSKRLKAHIIRYLCFAARESPRLHILYLQTQYFGCGHIQQKAPFPVRSTVVKLLRARPSSVVGDHTRNSRAAIYSFFLVSGLCHYDYVYLRAIDMISSTRPYSPPIFRLTTALSGPYVICYCLKSIYSRSFQCTILHISTFFFHYKIPVHLQNSLLTLTAI